MGIGDMKVEVFIWVRWGSGYMSRGIYGGYSGLLGMEFGVFVENRDGLWVCGCRCLWRIG